MEWDALLGPLSTREGSTHPVCEIADLLAL
jgi:hypothetical protein